MFYNNLVELCRRKSTAPSVVAKELGFSSSMPTAWKRGAIPKADTIQKIADYFGVTADELLNELPDAKIQKGDPGVKIPVLANVGAGIPQSTIYTFDQDDPDSWEEISDRQAHMGQHFALRIRGDSMEPLVRHDDIVIVRIMDHYEDGDYVVALVRNDNVGENEGLCKRLKYKSDGISLISENPDYPPRNFTKQEVREGKVKIVGKCIERRGKM